MHVHHDRLVPDLILHGGKIITLDARSRITQAVAVADGKIVAVGSDAAILPLAGGPTRVVDLHGASVVPGLIDNHTHLVMAGMDSAEAGVKVNIAYSESIEEIKARITAAALGAKPGEWIVTSCMYRGGLKEGRFPNRHDLDVAAPDNPVYIADGGRNVIVNTTALRLADISAETEDPGGDPEVAAGHIVRDDQGVPTGHLIVGAGDLGRRRWWKRLGLPVKMWDLFTQDLETNVRAIAAQMKVFNAAGITGARDMGVSPEEIDAYTEIVRRGEATLRTDLILGLAVQHLSSADISEALRVYFGPKQGFGGDWLRVGGLKIVAQNYGYWSMQPDKLRKLIVEGNRYGWSFAIHGTPGDLGNDIEVILDAMEEADAESPLDGKRWSYEHAFGLVQPEYIKRMRRLGVVIAANPLLSYFGAGRAQHMHEVMETLRLAETGDGITPRERTIREWGQPMRTWIDAGLTVTAGTDCPAVAYDQDRPLLGLWACFSQETLAGKLMPGEEIRREEALRLWTINNAYATFQESRKGSIEPGKLADMVVLSGDPLTIPDEKFLELQVLETIVDGRTVHERA
ncbi:amidohydrolase [Streptomyces sp. NPDC051217]|uniref:amidohydrolase n=1 Tax=Streptomyces sp. NPDC051217 TaxID=3365644 RepID=UPI00379C8C91